MKMLKVVDSWSNGEWFTNKPKLPEVIKAIVFRVEGEINMMTSLLQIPSRPDITSCSCNVKEDHG